MASSPGLGGIALSSASSGYNQILTCWVTYTKLFLTQMCKRIRYIAYYKKSVLVHSSCSTIVRTKVKISGSLYPASAASRCDWQGRGRSMHFKLVYRNLLIKTGMARWKVITWKQVNILVLIAHAQKEYDSTLVLLCQLKWFKPLWSWVTLNCTSNFWSEVLGPFFV